VSEGDVFALKHFSVRGRVLPDRAVRRWYFQRRRRKTNGQAAPPHRWAKIAVEFFLPKRSSRNQRPCLIHRSRWRRRGNCCLSSTERRRRRRRCWASNVDKAVREREREIVASCGLVNRIWGQGRPRIKDRRRRCRRGRARHTRTHTHILFLSPLKEDEDLMGFARGPTLSVSRQRLFSTWR